MRTYSSENRKSNQNLCENYVCATVDIVGLYIQNVNIRERKKKRKRLLHPLYPPLKYKPESLNHSINILYRNASQFVKLYGF